MEPIASFSGLASGIQWRDMIEQIMRIENARRLTPVTQRVQLQEKRQNAWGDFGGLVAKLRDSAASFADASAFGLFKTSVSESPSGRALVSATASSTASPGTYNVEVVELAKAEKLGSAAVADASAALNLSGTFQVNGKAVSLASTDSLIALRDKINAANSGTGASGVTATILSTSATSHRLILTADDTGARGIELVDSDTGVLQSAALGILSGTQVRNASPTDSSRTDSLRLASSSQTLEVALGVTPPPAVTTVKIDGRQITIDFASDTLLTLQNKIVAAGGTASIEQESVGGTTKYRLSVGGTVEADPAASDPANSQRVVELLGFVKNTSANQITAGADAKFQIDNYTLTRRSNTVTDAIQGVTIDLLATDAASRTSTVSGALAIAADPKTIDAGTYSVDITAAATRAAATGSGFDGSYDAASLLTPDWIGITDGAGNTATVNLSSGESLATIVSNLNNAFTASGVAMQAVDSGGQLKLESTAAAGSSSTFSVTSSGGTVQTNLGIADGAYAGTDQEVTIAGQAAVWDAATSTIRGAAGSTFEGLALTYSGAGAAGKVGDLVVSGDISVDLTISRDSEETTAKVQALVDAYNEVAAFVERQRDAKGPLSSDGSLRSMRSALRDTLFAALPGLSGTNPYTRLSLAGVEFTRDGTLSLDSTAFAEALADSPADVEELFAEFGTLMETTADAISDEYTGSVKLHKDALATSIASLEARELNVKARLERQREGLVRQFTAMEEALSKLQSQGSWLTSQLSALQSNY